MSRKSKKRRTAYSRFDRVREFFQRDGVRHAARLSAWSLLILVLLTGAAFAAKRTERYVVASLDRSVTRATLSFVDLPASLESLAQDDLNGVAADLLERSWTGDELCRELAERLSTCGWVEEVQAVRRIADGSFEVDARYRVPSAMVASDEGFILIDAQRVRLPGVYLYDASWTIIQGVDARPPVAGREWIGTDVHAGASIVALLRQERFAHQITAVLVDNLGGRVDSRGTEIELATDRAGGRIRWGSAPGTEIAENSAIQKLAILRANFRQTGRADAGRPVIDVFTFPDRYSIPG